MHLRVVESVRVGLFVDTPRSGPRGRNELPMLEGSAKRSGILMDRTIQRGSVDRPGFVGVLRWPRITCLLNLLVRCSMDTLEL